MSKLLSEYLEAYREKRLKELEQERKRKRLQKEKEEKEEKERLRVQEEKERQLQKEKEEREKIRVQEEIEENEWEDETAYNLNNSPVLGNSRKENSLRDTSKRPKSILKNSSNTMVSLLLYKTLHCSY